MPNIPKLAPTTWSLLGTLAVTVLLGGGLTYWKFFGPGATPETENPPSRTERGSLISYMNGEGTWECRVKSSSNTVDSTGVVFVAPGQMRGDFSSILKMGEPRTSYSHMIVRGGEQFVWNDDMPSMGVRTTVTLATIPKNAAPDAPFDIHHESDVDCVPWRENDRVFVLPNDVQFHSVEEMMKQKGLPSAAPVAPGASSGMPDLKSQCAACDQAGPYKESCLAALSCPKAP
jgi:hypothetical protein